MSDTSGTAAKVAPAGARAAVRKSINWGLIQTWFLRTLAVGWLLQGLVAWSVIIGADPAVAKPFENQRMSFQAITIYFSVVDLLAAVGMWLLAPWGAVVWLIATISRLVLGVVFPAVHQLTVVEGVAFVVCIITFMGLSWLSHRTQPA